MTLCTGQIEAAARLSLRIYEVQTSVNDLPSTVFSPPTPGSIYFSASEDTTSTGIVSLWCLPVTEYFNSKLFGSPNICEHPWTNAK